MKKLITLILVLALLIPVAALAGESDVVGCWAHYELNTEGAPIMIVLYLSADHTCYYLAQGFHPDSEGLGRTYIGTWAMKPGGTVYAKTGNNTSMTLTFSKTFVGAMDLETSMLFVNLTKYD